MNGRYAILETADGLPCGACLIGPAGSDKSLIGLAKELYKGWNNRWFPQQTIMQQDSNTTQATDRAETDALSFGAKKIAILIGVGLIAGSLHCLC